jgi:hypothetical protein
MKSTSKKRTPSILNLTVKRRYLTQREIERLMGCARKHGRYGHRDATMILVGYRHGLRARAVRPEVVAWRSHIGSAACVSGSESAAGSTFHLNRVRAQPFEPPSIR